MKTKIIRADGIKYERKARQAKYNDYIYVRVSSDTVDKLHKIADNKNIKYSDLIRNLIKDYIENGE